MKIDTVLMTGLTEAPSVARVAEAAGYDGLWTAETSHDPFFPLLRAAEASERLELGTGIAVAFARNPMTLATTAWDLQTFSGGRFLLGLGSQVKPHITNRFSMPWSHPAARMKEFIEALRAIWDCWQHGTRLDFRGTYYTHTLMTWFFNPGPNPHGIPRVFLAAVGPAMTRVAGEVADGLVAHAFTTASYLRDVTLPALEEGLAAASRPRATFEVSGPFFVVTGDDEEAYVAADRAVRQQLAFYGSTPGYRGVLAHHGWEDLQPRLNELMRDGHVDAMTALISDEMLDAFAVVAENPAQVGAKLAERFGGLVDRVTVPVPPGIDPHAWSDALAPVRAA